VALPWLGWLRGADEEVEGYKAELWTGFGGLRCGVERARAHRSKGGDGGSVFPLGRGESKRERGRGASEGGDRLRGVLLGPVA
jgi:hypothetical protein